MKNFIIGFVVGILLGATAIVYADMSVLYSSNGTELGTASNPINVINI